MRHSEGLQSPPTRSSNQNKTPEASLWSPQFPLSDRPALEKKQKHKTVFKCSIRTWLQRDTYCLNSHCFPVYNGFGMLHDIKLLLCTECHCNLLNIKHLTRAKIMCYHFYCLYIIDWVTKTSERLMLQLPSAGCLFSGMVIQSELSVRMCSELFQTLINCFLWCKKHFLKVSDKSVQCFLRP